MPMQAGKSIPIHSSAPAPAGCGACAGQGDAPACLALNGRPCDNPQLVGPPELLRQVMDELGRQLGTEGGHCGPAVELVHALRLGDGEAELTLGVRRDAGGALLLDTAFQTLRRLLPDTDIYVSQAA